MAIINLDDAHPFTVSNADGSVSGIVSIGDWTFKKHLDSNGVFLYLDRVFVLSITGNDVQYDGTGLSDNILSARKRLDGCWGFQLSDGTNNLLAPAEIGIIKTDGTHPTTADIDAVKAALIKNPTDYASEPVKVWDHASNPIYEFTSNTEII